MLVHCHSTTDELISSQFNSLFRVWITWSAVIPHQEKVKRYVLKCTPSLASSMKEQTLMVYCSAHSR